MQAGTMSQDAFERFLGRLITDESFRRCAAGCCLERICLQEGYSLTPGELRMAGGIDLLAIDSIALRIDPGLLRAPRVLPDNGEPCSICRGPE